MGDLRDYERSGAGDGDRVYARWHLAVRDLLRRARRRPKAIRDFCTAVGDGTAWRTAFDAAFGLPVKDFYRTFGAALPGYRRGDRAL